MDIRNSKTLIAAMVLLFASAGASAALGPLVDSDLVTIDEVNENLPAGATVGVTAFAPKVAPDVTSDVTYSLSNDAGGRFQIDPVTGEVTTKALLNHEANNSLAIFIRADQDGPGPGKTVFLGPVNIAIRDVNDDPVAGDDSLSVDEDASGDHTDVAGGNLLFNDSDEDLDGLTVNVSPIVNVQHGALTLFANGKFSYTHDGGEDVSDSFTYEISDGLGGLDTAVVSITINPINDLPEAADDVGATDENVDLNGTLPVATDAEANLDSNGYLVVSQPDNGGSVTVDPDGDYTFLPGADFDGLATGATQVTKFTYTASDNDGGTSLPATITITVTGINDAPTVSADTGATNENVTLNGTVPVGVDEEGLLDINSYAVGTNADNGGSVTINPNGSYTFNPGVDFDDLGTGATRQTTFTYTVNDQSGVTSDPANVVITVTGVNDLPVASADSKATNENVTLVSNVPVATDEEGLDANSYAVSTPLDNGGALTFNADGSYTFDPQTDFDDLVTAATRVTQFGYTVDDFEGGTSTEVFVDITVTGVNDAPTVSADTGATNENVTLNGTVPVGVDEEGLLDINSYALGTNADNGGSVTINPNGSYTFNPGVDFDDLGTGATRQTTFTYTVDDQSGVTSDPANVVITVTGVNDLPVASADSKATNENVTLVSNVPVATDEEGLDANSYAVSTPLDNGGALTFNADGSYTFDPQTDFDDLVTAATRVTQFGYTVDDFEGGTSTEVFVDITVTGINDAPTVSADTGATNENVTLNDTVPVGVDEEGLLDVNSYAVGTNADNGGSVTINPNGSYTFNPGVDFDDLGTGATRQTTFTYTVDDQSGVTSDPANVVITVTGVNDLPVASADSKATNENVTLVSNVPVATDEEGLDANSYAVSTPLDNGGALTFNADGSYTFDPQTDFDDLVTAATRVTQFGYTVDDFEGGTSTEVLVDITVTGVNDLPVASADTVGTTENTPLLDTLPAGVDEEGLLDLNGYAVVSTPDNGGSVTINPNGSYTFDPGVDFDDLIVGDTRVTEFTYSVDDQEGGTSAAAAVEVTVTGTNDQPVANTDTDSTDEDNDVLVNLIANDTDLDSGETATLTIQSLDLGATTGSVVIEAGNKTVTYDPNGQFEALTASTIDSFDYVVVDAQGATQTGTANITVTPVNDAPSVSAPAAPASFDEDTSTTVGFSIADVDADTSTVSVTLDVSDGDLTVVAAGGAIVGGNGTSNVTVNGTVADINSTIGSIDYAPDANFNGSDTLTVGVNDGGNNGVGGAKTDSDSVSFTIDPVNDVPVMDDIANQTIDEDNDTGALPFTADEDDQGGLANENTQTLALVSATSDNTTLIPNGNIAVTFNDLGATGSGSVTATPVADLNGTATITIVLTDGTDTVQDEFDVTVTPVNDPPTVETEFADFDATEDDADDTFNIAFVFNDVDLDDLPLVDSLTYDVSSSDATIVDATMVGADMTLDYQGNKSGTVEITIEAEDGSGAKIEDKFDLNVIAVADVPSLVVTPTATGDEDTSIALAVAGTLADADGSETLTYLFDGVPDDVVLSAGTDNLDNSWTLNSTDVAGLTVSQPAHAAEDFSLSITATATEGLNGDSADSTTSVIDVTFNDVADAPTLTVADPLTVDEDVAVGLGINAALVDTDTSESLTVTISGLPMNAEISDGVNSSQTAVTDVSAWVLNAITVVSAPNSDADFVLTVTATAEESDGNDQASTIRMINVFVDAVADMPSLVAADTVNADEDSPSDALAIVASLADTDLSETLTVILEDVPSGAVVTDGGNTVNAVGGDIDVTGWTLAGITITPPADTDGDFTVTTVATATELNGGDTATTEYETDVVVTAVADVPAIGVANASGNEDTAISLSISGSSTDGDVSETITFLISNVPTGAVLSAGTDNLDNTWSLTAGQVAGLQITPPLHIDDDINLQVESIATDTDGPSASSGQQLLIVEVLAVPDQPSVSAGDVTGDEDTTITLAPGDLSGSLVDTDTSETLSYRVTGVSADVVFSPIPDQDLGGGQFIFTKAQVDGGIGISLGTTHLGTDLDLQWYARATEANDGAGFAESAPAAMHVEFVDRADSPNLVVNDPVGIVEEDPVPLDISTTLTDSDGSETITIVITDVPTVGNLSSGSDAGGGTWNLVPGDLAGLTLTLPTHFADDFTLNVSATSTEGDDVNDTLTENGAINVVIANVNDTPTIAGDTFTIDENTPNGTLVGTLVLDDPETTNMEAGASFGVSLDTTAFAIDNDGQITVADVAQVDFEVTPVFNLTVTILDSGGLDATDSVVINLNPLNDSSPVGVADAVAVDEQGTVNFNVLDNDSDEDEPIDTITVKDVDGDIAKVDTPFDVIIGGKTVGSLTINTDGSASFVATNDATVEVYETSHTYTVTDGTNDDVNIALDITINPINDNMPVVTAAGTSFAAAPTVFEEDEHSDANRLTILMASFFQDLDIDEDGLLDGSVANDKDSLVLTVVNNTNPALIQTNIDPANPTDVKLWSPANEFGTAALTIRATDTATPGVSSVDMVFNVTVDSVNDPPIYVTDSYVDVAIPEDSAPFVVQLDSAFVDADIDSDSTPGDDSHTYLLTIDDRPNPFVQTPVLDTSGLTVISESDNVPAAGSRRVVIETTDSTFSLPLEANAHGSLTVNVRASDQGMPPNVSPIPLSANQTFVITVDAVGDDTPVAMDDHYMTRVDLVMQEDGDAIIFEVTSNDDPGDAPIEVVHVGTEITDFLGTHVWRTSSRMADPDNTGDLRLEINGEVSCAHPTCIDNATPDTLVDGSGLSAQQITYKPNANFNGEDTFFYCIQDSAPSGETPAVLDIDPSDPRCAMVTVMVEPVNDLPTPQDPVTFVMNQTEDLIADASSGLVLKVVDIDNTAIDGIGCTDVACTPGVDKPAPDTLYFFLNEDMEHGSFVVSPGDDGGFHYRPDATFFGQDSFTFDVCETAVPAADTCVFDVTANIVVEPIADGPEGDVDDVVERDFDLSDTPLELPVGPESNVMLINDDSGSMRWDILTDDNNGNYYFPGSNNYVRYLLPQTLGSDDGNLAPDEASAAGQGLWRVRTSDYNTVYYNPNIRYLPWNGLDSTNSEFVDSDPNAAPLDPWATGSVIDLELPIDYTGEAVVNTPQVCNNVCIFSLFGTCFISIPVCTGGAGFNDVDVDDYYIPRYYTWTDLDGDNEVDATPSPVGEPAACAADRTEANGCSEGVLTLINAASAPFPKAAARTDCAAEDSCTFDEELQNFANWFTYSRNREYTAKSALGKVVAAAENIRVGYAKLNTRDWTCRPENQSFFNSPLSAADYQDCVDDNTVAIQSMNNSERAGAKKELLDEIYQTGASGGTPLRLALDRAGRHFECLSGDLYNSSSNTSPGDAECPIQAAPEGNCQSNYTLLMSDGAWNGNDPSVGDTDDDPSDTDTNFDGGVYATTSSNTLADVAMHYYERDLNTLDNEVPTSSRDTAGAADDAFEDNNNTFMHQHMKTFTVGFGVNGEVTDDMVPTDYTTAFNWGLPTNTARKVDDMRHAAINGRGQFLSAGDASQLSDALVSAFEEFAQGSGAASAVSFNSQEIREDTLVFRSFYNTKTNTGDLIAQPIDENGDVGDVVWSAAEALDSKGYDTREIFTWNPVIGEGVPFRPDTDAKCTPPCLSAAQLAVFSADPAEIADKIYHLRGDDSNERPVGNLRERPIEMGRLGDIVHSAPIFIGAPRASGRDNPPYPQNNLFSDFRNDPNVFGRRNVVYVAANDGMLHGFDAEDGEEVFGFVPGNLMTGDYSENITQLLNYEYVHKNFVDLTPAVSDVYTDFDRDGDFAWETLLIGGQGTGGKAYFALRITDPSKLTEATADEVVMWEFTEEDDSYPTYTPTGDAAAPFGPGPAGAGGTPFTDGTGPGGQRQDLQFTPKGVKDLGYTFSVPTMVLTNLTIGSDDGDADDEDNLRYAAIAGNGYNSTAGIAKLFVLFLEGGEGGLWCHPDMKHNLTPNGSLDSNCVGKQHFVKLDTGAGVQDGLANGMGTPRGVDTDLNGTTDVVYAGDFFGNLYRFDLCDRIPDDEVVDADDPRQPGDCRDSFEGWSVTKIFQATYGVGETPQPITTQPIVIRHPTEDEGFIIIFGTGSYIRNGDSEASEIQSIYGIWDRLAPETITKAELVEQNYTNLPDELGLVRTLSANDVDYAGGGKKGWYIDLDVPAAGNANGLIPEFPGEKAIRNIQLRGGLAFVNSVFPREENSCVALAGGATLSFCPDTGGSGCLLGKEVFDLNNDGRIDELDRVGPGDNLTAMGRIIEDPAPPTDATFIGDKRVTQFGSELDIIGTNTSQGINTGRLSWKRLNSVD